LKTGSNSLNSIIEEKNNISNIKQIVFGLPNFNLTSLLGGPPVAAPYLPTISNKYKYSLVLDLDETLVHFFYTPSGGSFLIRPYCFEFLVSMSEIFEVIVFTAAMKDVS